MRRCFRPRADKHLGGPSATNLVNSLKVMLNYTAPNQTPLSLNATGYVSFDGSDSSNPVVTGQVRVK
jgi:hypothetical protein